VTKVNGRYYLDSFSLRWKDDSEMFFRRKENEAVELHHLPKDRALQWAPENVVLKLRVSI
jgi:hypothetical protein